MAIGLGVIGMNPTNMGSTATLLKDVPDLKYETPRYLCKTGRCTWRTTPTKLAWTFWTTDYRELVQREDISVIAIYSPDHLHAEHCVAAIEAGKHVICTKPMVTKLDGRTNTWWISCVSIKSNSLWDSRCGLISNF